MRPALLPACIMMALAGAALGESPELVTDRPDQTESTSIVTPGRFQVEAGWTHASSVGGGATFSSDAVPETLVRIGLRPDLELRLIHGGWGAERLDPGGSLGSGFNDGAVGVKYHFFDEEGARPDTSLNVHLGLPIGESGRSSGRFDPDFRFLFAHGLPRELSLSWNAGIAWAPTATFEYTASLARDLSEEVGAFVELFGEFPSGGGTAAHSLDGGLTFGPRKNLQFDVEAGVGLTDAAEDWFAGLGVSIRFPD